MNEPINSSQLTVASLLFTVSIKYWKVAVTLYRRERRWLKIWTSPEKCSLSCVVSKCDFPALLLSQTTFTPTALLFQLFQAPGSSAALSVKHSALCSKCSKWFKIVLWFHRTGRFLDARRLVELINFSQAAFLSKRRSSSLFKSSVLFWQLRTCTTYRKPSRPTGGDMSHLQAKKVTAAISTAAPPAGN